MLKTNTSGTRIGYLLYLYFLYHVNKYLTLVNFCLFCYVFCLDCNNKTDIFVDFYLTCIMQQLFFKTLYELCYQMKKKYFAKMKLFAETVDYIYTLLYSIPTVRATYIQFLKIELSNSLLHNQVKGSHE